MKREFHPFYAALFLIFGCAIFRLLSSHYPEVMPDISPLMAIAYVGGLCLPRRWGWLIGPAAMLVTDPAFLEINFRTNGAMFTWWSVVSLVIYAGAGWLGLLVARRASLVRIVSGSLVCSLLFYVAANTFSWWHNVAAGLMPAYAPNLAGWWQANTVGLPGYEPTWLFLRNGVSGDIFFVLVLLLILDRGLLFGHASSRCAIPTA